MEEDRELSEFSAEEDDYEQDQQGKDGVAV